MTMDPEDSIRRMSSTQIDTAIDRIKREQSQLQEEMRLLEAERERRMIPMLKRLGESEWPK
jgi:hypothetical protein